MVNGVIFRRTAAAFSLVELLVATAITLIGLLVIAQVFAVYEGWKRTTTGVAQTQESGLLGAFAIEQDLRHAGFGMIGLGCPVIGAYNARNASPSISFAGMPITIGKDTPVAGSDRIEILYGDSPFANVAATIQSDLSDSAAVLRVDHGVGFNDRYPDSLDLLLIKQSTKDCAIVQMSGPAVVDGTNVTAPGSSWRLPHAAGDTAPWNPPEGQNIFPVGGYTVGATVLNLGQLVNHAYYVADNVLRMDERSPVDGSVTSYDLIPGVVGLRADCLPAGAGCSEATKAVRFGLIVRSGQREKSAVEQSEVTRSGSDAYIAYWPGDGAPRYALDAEGRHYRYRVFQTIVPLKNIIWNP